MAIPIINVSILNGSNGFRVDGSDRSGDSVSSAGDVNGDGFDDVIIGGDSPGPGIYGSSYVVFGQAAGFSATLNLANLDGNNGFSLGNAPKPSFLSQVVSDAGDVNGDGFDDVIIGASNGSSDYYGLHLRDGTSYIVFGRTSGFAANMDLSTLDGSNGFRLDVAGGGDVGGDVTVSGAGDFNGDGFDDVIVGVSDVDPNGIRDAGSSYVVFGRASGFDAAMDLSSVDGSNGFRLNGVAEDDESGFSVSSAGDVNGDGFDDLIIGSLYGYGSSYVVFGKASGFGAAMDLSGLDGTNGFRVNGVAVSGYFSSSVSSAGDVNGDGFADLIIGAPYAGVSGTRSGSSYVVFGKATGFSAAMDLSSLDGSNGFRLDGVAEFDGVGHSVSSAGDFNGDGFDDLLVSAPFADSDGDSSGSSYVVFGKASGFAAAMNLSSLDGNNGFRLDGGGSGDSVSSAGDVNSDGFDDLIIDGFYAVEPNGDYSGSSYVVFGGNFFTGEAVYLGTAGNDNLTGTILAERFEASGGNDRMTGRGGADIFHGDAGDDTIAVPDVDFQSVDGGAGGDTLELTGGSINLDLANFTDTIDGIETIDLTGSGDNTLTLTLPDLLSLSDTTDTFTVNGDTDDEVVGLTEGWTDGGNDGDYRIFTNGGTTLRVHRDVHTDVPIADVINVADLDGNNGFRLDGTKFDSSGASVSSAGDVNGDGFADVIIGAPGIHASYVVFGKSSGFDAAMNLSGLDGSDGFRLDVDLSGYSVSNAGDVNGDGFDDVIIGAPEAGLSGSRSGSSYVAFGKATDFAATLDLSGLDGNNGFRLDGAAEGDLSGVSVSNAGDVNGDGFDDVIVSAPYADPDGIYGAGASYVIFGQASGFAATMNLSSLDGSNGFRLDGAKEDDRSGFSVSNAGDVNGDGFDDVIIGAPSADPNGYGSGSSYVVFGRASGFSAAMDLSNLDGSDGFRLDGESHDCSGLSVSTAGDVNGDGFDDLLVGAPYADPNGNFSGFSYVVFGRASGFSAAMDLSNLDGSNGFRLDGESHDRSGLSVSNAGDVNGDGFDDVIIGTPGANSSYVVFGKASGFDAVMNLSSIDGSNGFRLDGTFGGFGYIGSSISNAGDVNGDGFDDLIAGDRFANPNGDVSGSSYVIFGRSDFGGGQPPTIPGTPDDDVLRGTSAAEIFEAGDGNDVMIGGGGADVFRSGVGVDQIKIPDLNFESIDGGAGNDILHLAGADLNLDLTDVGDKIRGIETICLYGRGDNTLSLTADSVLDLSDTSNTLKLHGNAGDRVMVQDDGWVDGGAKGFYHTYSNDDAVLLVGANVTVEFA